MGVSEGVSGGHYIRFRVLVKKVTFANAGQYPVSRGPVQNKKVEKVQVGSLCLSWGICLLLPLDISHQCFWFSCFRTQTGLTPSAPNSQSFRLSLNYTTDFPSSSARRLWDFHNHINHSYNKSLFYIFIIYIYIYHIYHLYLYIYPLWFCLSREP